MSTPTSATPALTGTRLPPVRSDAVFDGSRRRALIATAVVTLASVVLLADLFLVGHTNGEEVWGLITAASAVLIGLLSLAFVAVHGRNRVARGGLIVLWLTVAFLGIGGYNSHRLALPEGTVDPRPRPPLAPLVFTGLGIAGAISLRTATRGM